MSTATAIRPFATALLLPRAAHTTAPALRRVRQPATPAAPAALWRQSLAVNTRRSLVERFLCIVLIVLAAAAIAYGALMTVRTLSGSTMHNAVSRIAAGQAR